MYEEVVCGALGFPQDIRIEKIEGVGTDRLEHVHGSNRRVRGLGLHTPPTGTYSIRCRIDSRDGPATGKADEVGLALGGELVDVRRKYGAENDVVAWTGCAAGGQEMGRCGEADGVCRW